MSFSFKKILEFKFTICFSIILVLFFTADVIIKKAINKNIDIIIYVTMK